MIRYIENTSAYKENVHLVFNLIYEVGFKKKFPHLIIISEPCNVIVRTYKILHILLLTLFRKCLIKLPRINLI